jgi:small subunit ribosomal protein S6
MLTAGGYNIQREVKRMRDYESIFILNPNIEEGESERVTLKMQEVVAANGGEVTHVEKWGKRKLAYEIGKHKKGEYVLFQFKGEAVTVAELERNYKMTDPVIKFLTVRMEKEMILAVQQARLAQAEAQAQAEAAAAAAAAGEPAPEAKAAEPEEASAETEEAGE